MTEFSPLTVVNRVEEAATTGGHLHVLEWLYKHELFDMREAQLAAKHDYRHVFQWLRAKAYVSPALHSAVPPTTVYSTSLDLECLASAANDRHLHEVRWLAQEIDRDAWELALS
jgi:hypothetical protein